MLADKEIDIEAAPVPFREEIAPNAEVDVEPQAEVPTASDSEGDDGENEENVGVIEAVDSDDSRVTSANESEDISSDEASNASTVIMSDRASYTGTLTDVSSDESVDVAFHQIQPTVSFPRCQAPEVYEELEKKRRSIATDDILSDGSLGPNRTGISYRNFKSNRKNEKKSNIPLKNNWRHTKYRHYYFISPKITRDIFNFSRSQLTRDENTSTVSLFNDERLNSLMLSVVNCNAHNGILSFDDILSIYRYNDESRSLCAQDLFQVLKRIPVSTLRDNQLLLLECVRYVFKIYTDEIYNLAKNSVKNSGSVTDMDDSLVRLMYCLEQKRLGLNHDQSHIFTKSRYCRFKTELTRNRANDSSATDANAIKSPLFADKAGREIFKSFTVDLFFKEILPLLHSLPQITISEAGYYYEKSSRFRLIRNHATVSTMIVATDRLLECGTRHGETSRDYKWQTHHWSVIHDTYHELMEQGYTVSAVPFSYFVSRLEVMNCCAKVSKLYLCNNARMNQLYNSAASALDHQRAIRKIAIFDSDPGAWGSVKLRKRYNQGLAAVIERRVFRQMTTDSRATSVSRATDFAPIEPPKCFSLLHPWWADCSDCPTDYSSDDNAIELPHFSRSCSTGERSTDKPQNQATSALTVKNRLTDIAVRSILENDGISSVLENLELPQQTRFLPRRFMRLTVREFLRYILYEYDTMNI